MKEELVQEILKAIQIAAVASIVTSSAYLTYRFQKWALDH